MDHVGAEVDALVAHRLGRHAVAAALAQRGTATVDELLGEVYGDVTERQLPVARFSLWAHLRALGQEDRATPTDAAAGEDTIESRWASSAGQISCRRLASADGRRKATFDRSFDAVE